MTEQRLDIPADLRRRVLLEAGHRCAIPSCRHMDVDVHHIIPWENCHTHEYENLIALCPNCHRRADRGDIDRLSLRAYKANLRVAHDRFSQFELDFLFDSYRVMDATKYPACFSLFFRRLIDTGYLKVWRGAFGVEASVMHGIDMTPVSFAITEEGRAYVESPGTLT